MNREDFNRLIASTQILVFFQRATRLGLRATWLGIAFYLLARVINIRYGWLPESWTWILVGALFALLPLGRIVLAWPTRQRLAWNLDRRLGLKEQVSTASNAAIQPAAGALESHLIADAGELLTSRRASIFKRGWFIGGEVVSVLIALTLLTIVIIADQQARNLMPPVGLASTGITIPPMAEEPSLKDVFPDGVLGLPAEPTALPTESQPGLNLGEMAALGETIQKMGESFSQQAATYELGQAFENLDPQAAAEALDGLADLSDELSPQTSQALADAMQQASQEIAAQSSSEMNQQLSQDLGDAAQALGEQAAAQSQDGGESGAQPAGSAGELAQTTQASIQKLAQDMRTINQMMQLAQGVGGTEAGLGSDTGSEGSAEPVERLQGQGSQQLELPTSASKPGGILSPNPPAGMGSTSVGGSLVPGSLGSSEIINSLIIPYTYPWFWRNVVATYFQSD